MPTRYDLIYYLFVPFFVPYVLFRAIVQRKYHHSAKVMLGRDLPKGEKREALRSKGSVWMHAVSVGETVAAKAMAPLVREMLPNHPLVVTTVTETGQPHARKILTEADHIHYFPVDLSWNVRRFQRCFNPEVFILMETELWPNFLTLAKKRGTQTFMVNGKISERSFGRYMKVRGMLRPAFDAISAFCMQSELDAERMRQLSGRPDDVYVTGNCKFDVPFTTLDETAAEEMRAKYKLGSSRPTVVVGSTHPGEEERMIQAFAEIREEVPDAQMILSPRHPERFQQVFDMFRNNSHGWSVSRASDPTLESPDVFILDTMGELARIYGLGNVAVVAGSFCQVGGHNLLEAAVHSVPVVVGPHMHSQKEIDRLFRGDDTGCVRTSGPELGQVLLGLLSDPDMAARLGEQARQTALANQGSARRSAEVIRQYLNG
ncbi:MAG: 3-deoxy-D-manno-octulosonic acid transferase [Candidatus Sumerlaeota bacterium]